MAHNLQPSYVSLSAELAEYFYPLLDSVKQVREDEKQQMEKILFGFARPVHQPERCKVPPAASETADNLDRPRAERSTMADAAGQPPVVRGPSTEKVLEMEHKQRSAWKFMEQSVRPQKATQEQLDRFCDLLQRPSVFESVKMVVSELNWDQSFTTHPNPMIVQMLKATQQLRPRPPAQIAQEESALKPVNLGKPQLPLFGAFDPRAPGSGDHRKVELSSSEIRFPQVESSSSKAHVITSSTTEAVRSEVLESPIARTNARSPRKRFLRPTQVEDLSKIPVQTPFANGGTKAALWDANLHLWEMHCAGKNNTTPIHSTHVTGLWPSDYPENYVISTKDAIRRLIKDMVVLDDKKPWTPNNYTELREALADEEYGGEEALVAMAQSWGVDDVGHSTRRAFEQEEDWKITTRR